MIEYVALPAAFLVYAVYRDLGGVATSLRSFAASERFLVLSCGLNIGAVMAWIAISLT